MRVSSTSKEQFWERNRSGICWSAWSNVDRPIEWNFNPNSRGAGKDDFSFALRVFTKSIVSGVLRDESTEISLRPEILAGYSAINRGVAPFSRVERIVTLITYIGEARASYARRLRK